MRSDRATRQVCTGINAEQHPLAPLVVGAVTTLTLLVAFSLLALGVESFWVVFVVGFGGVLPLSLGVLDSQQPAGSNGSQREETDDALAELRQRYAAGELTDTEFERQVERLLETESSEISRRQPD